jgi:hypothetical protein
MSGLSRFLLPTFLCGKQRKVGAAPHSNALNLSPKGLVYGAFAL